jgi:hypothetical protein
MGKAMQARAQKFGREYEKAAENGFEAASRSFGEANRGFQALAAEMMSYSKEAFDDAVRTWEQLIGEFNPTTLNDFLRTTWLSCRSLARCMSDCSAMPP